MIWFVLFDWIKRITFFGVCLIGYCTRIEAPVFSTCSFEPFTKLKRDNRPLCVLWLDETCHLGSLFFSSHLISFGIFACILLILRFTSSSSFSGKSTLIRSNFWCSSSLPSQFDHPPDVRSRFFR